MDLIITPMLDMAFQLLAFFVVTYNPAAIEVHIDGRLLPPDKAAVSNDQAPQDKPPEPKPDVAPTDEEPKVEEFITVYVKSGTAAETVNDGKPTQIIITTKQHPDPLDPWQRFEIENDETVNLGGNPRVQHYEPAMRKLTELLVEKKKDLTGIDFNLKLKLDKALKHAHAVRIWDACHASGMKKIGFLPPKD